MRQGCSILTVVPARGNSKGIKLKNLLKLCGKTLVEHTADVIKQCDFIDHTIVSTDHPEIKKEAIRVGLAAPFTRPDHLSGDCVSDIQVLQHALKESETIFKREFDVIVMLQPTSPLRTFQHIVDCIDVLINNKLDSCFTVSETDSKAHPLKQLKIENNKVTYYDPAGESIIARQMLKPVYHRNGICYAFTRTCLMEQKKLITANSSALIIKDYAISIDTMRDVACAEGFLRERDNCAG